MIKDGCIGNAKSMLMSTACVIDAVVPLLKKNSGFLLCDDPECVSCTRRKAFLEYRN